MASDSAGIITLDKRRKVQECRFCGSHAGHSAWCVDGGEVPEFSLNWIVDAVCGGEDMFGGGRVDKRIFELCEGCPVRRECAEYAIGMKQNEGIWGGLTPQDRREVRAGFATLEEALS